MTGLFNRATSRCAKFVGTPWMMTLCVMQAGAGVYAYVRAPDSPAAGVNLAISITTLLLLPLVQATQNRDGAALHAKIDELIQAMTGARNDLIGLEQRSEAEIAALRVGGA